MAGTDKPGLGKTFGIVAVLTVLSKVVGLARDVVVSSLYGTGIVADAYNYAYMFTGQVLILFGGLGGPFHSTTVTVLGPRKNEPTAGTLMTQILLSTFVTLTVISLAVWLFAKPITQWMVNQYKPSSFKLHSQGAVSATEAFSHNQIAVLQQLFGVQFQDQLVIMLPLIVLAGLVGVAYGISNVFNRVAWPSLSPAIASIAIIVAVMLADPATRLTNGAPLAIGTLIGAFGQLFVQLPATFQSPLQWSFSTKAQPGLAEYNSMLWPAVFSTSVGQLTSYVDMGFTLYYLHEGAWTAVGNANRLIQLPLGVLLTAMLVPILPRFTEQATEDRIDDLKEEFRRALKILWFLGLPISAIFFAIPSPIIQLLFQRGNFDDHSTALVSTALFWLVPSIFFYVGRDLITRVFYAFKDSRTPYHVALTAIAVKSGLDWLILSQTNLGIGGISLATSIMTVFNLGLLSFFLRRKIGPLGISKVVKPMLIMLAATAASTAACYYSFEWLHRILTANFGAVSIGHRSLDLNLLLSIGVSSAIAFAVFALICIVFKLEEPLMVLKRIKRK